MDDHHCQNQPRADLLSVVVPCFNEQAVLPELYKRLTAVCQKTCGERYEIILVDDGSSDATWPFIADLSRQDWHIIAVRLTRNHGHQLALTAGLDIALGDRIFIIDADLQDPPELLDMMMLRMDAGAEIVYGQRQARQGEHWAKRISAQIFYRLLNRLVDVEIPVDTGDFRLISRKALDLVCAMPERQRFVRGMFAWVGLEQEPISYTRHERFAGETKYPLRKMIGLAIDAITGFSTKPLKIASYLGLMFAGLSLVGIGYTVWSWWVHDTVSGWASMMTVALILGSVQLMVLGVIGAYIGRMFVEIKQRPVFMIDQILQPEHRTQQLRQATGGGTTQRHDGIRQPISAETR